MRNRAALYEAVMGKLWENQQIRGKAYGRINVRISGRRQGHSYSKTGRASLRNVVKAASGQSRAAIFKRIRSGGCKTRTSLGNQLAYVNDKAVFTYASMNNALDAEAVLTEDQKSEIIEDWAETWQGTTKLGFTSHMLLSFPTDVTVEQVRDITMEWALHFFESGDYGDQWDYVLSVHDDRAHKHAHILLNNRGVDQGTWFSCWAEGAGRLPCDHAQETALLISGGRSVRKVGTHDMSVKATHGQAAAPTQGRIPVIRCNRENFMQRPRGPTFRQLRNGLILCIAAKQLRAPF